MGSPSLGTEKKTFFLLKFVAFLNKNIIQTEKKRSKYQYDLLKRKKEAKFYESCRSNASHLWETIAELLAYCKIA
jgi:hypothetical protein